jgi:hypothetical protein
MNIVDYVKENYDLLPKSTFNDEDCVIVKRIRDDDEGWGHHSYEGIGIGRGGQVYWCFSSGCSCNGSCGMDHVQTTKKFEVEGWSLEEIDHKDVNFNDLEVSFDDY